MAEKSAENPSNLTAMGQIGPDTAQTAAAASQFGLALAGADPAAVIVGPADRASRRMRRDGLRSDARRSAEYLASRGGRTPIEGLHDIAKLGWKDATRQLVAELRISPAAAFAIWQDCCAALLPYTAARLDGIDLGAALGVAGAAGAAGAAAHFLAASELGRELARDRAAVPGVASPVGNTVDTPETGGVASSSDHRSGSAHETVSQLPPKGSD